MEKAVPSNAGTVNCRNKRRENKTRMTLLGKNLRGKLSLQPKRKPGADPQDLSYTNKKAGLEKREVGNQ